MVRGALHARCLGAARPARPHRRPDPEAGALVGDERLPARSRHAVDVQVAAGATGLPARGRAACGSGPRAAPRPGARRPAGRRPCASRPPRRSGGLAGCPRAPTASPRRTPRRDAPRPVRGARGRLLGDQSSGIDVDRVHLADVGARRGSGRSRRSRGCGLGPRRRASSSRPAGARSGCRQCDQSSSSRSSSSGGNRCR